MLHSLRPFIVATMCAAASIGTTSAMRPQAQAPQAAQPLAIGETWAISSTVLKETRVINVYSPLGFAADTPALPVMYMPDGGVAEDFLHVAGLVQVLTGNGSMRPFLLVGIENTERRRDMTGPTTNDEDRKIAPRVGGSAGFREFIRTELMPAVQKRYRTTDETALVGESLAGLFTVETFLRAPEMFDTYIAIDPSLWWNNTGLIAEGPALLRASASVRRRLFVATSSEPTIAADARRFVDVVRASGGAAQVELKEFPTEQHSTIYHPAALTAFRVLFAVPPR
jgi:predicted alpha/beta superfamily hydrolase